MVDVCQEGCLGGGKLFIGDVGTEILVDVCADITGATGAVLCVLKPGASSTVNWVGTVHEGDKIRYVVLAGDFSAAGEYKVQAVVTTPSGVWRGGVARFRVYSPFEV